MRRRSRPSGKFLPRGLTIIHEDKDILVVDKPPDLLTIRTDTEKLRTAYFILTDYIRKGAAKSKKRIFIVHRLDRETSGVLIFAKSEEAKFYLQSHWKETKKLALLEVDLLTGRKHQIRVHLAGIGHPVVGDRRYGKENGAHKRLALHARWISFRHPFSGEQVTFETKVPAYLNQLVGSVDHQAAGSDAAV